MTNFDPNVGNTLKVEELCRCIKPECIITDKVFSQCQQRECFPDIEKDINGEEFDSIKFKAGFIVPGTLLVADLINRPNFKRVKFSLRIPYDIITKSGTVFEEFLPDIEKDVILFIPDDTRDEFDFRIVVETSSRVLGDVFQANGIINFAVGVFIIIKVVGRVQLYIPSMGYCPEPPLCEEFSPDGNICDEFENLPFPDFFPPQLEDIQNC